MLRASEHFAKGIRGVFVGITSSCRKKNARVEVGFRGSKGGQGRKGAVLVRPRTGLWGGEERGAVGLLAERFRMYNNGE